MHKMATPAFVAQAETLLSPSQRDSGVLDQLLGVLRAKTLEDLPENLQKHDSVAKLKELLGMLDKSKN